MRCARQIRVIQRVLKRSSEQFAASLEVPIGMPSDWEQGRKDPDAAACAYLRVLAREPNTVRTALMSDPRSTCAGIELRIILMLSSEAWTEITPSEFVDVMDDDVKTFDQRIVSTSNCVSSCLNLNWTTISLYRLTTVRALRQSNDKDHNYLVCLSSSSRRTDCFQRKPPRAYAPRRPAQLFERSSTAEITS